MKGWYKARCADVVDVLFDDDTNSQLKEDGVPLANASKPTAVAARSDLCGAVTERILWERQREKLRMC